MKALRGEQIMAKKNSQQKTVNPLKAEAVVDSDMTLDALSVSLTALDEGVDTSDIIENKPPKAEDYFGDDEEFLASADVVIAEEVDMGLFQQADNVISWEIQGFLKDNGNPRNKFALRNDPPIFVLKSSDGREAEFVVTEELSRSLGKLFNGINNAYLGVNSIKKKSDFSQKTMKDKLSHIISWSKMHPVKVTVTSLLVLLFIVPLFL